MLATYEKETKTGAGRHGDRKSIKGRRVQSLENAYHRGATKREEAEMVGHLMREDDDEPAKQILSREIEHNSKWFQLLTADLA